MSDYKAPFKGVVLGGNPRVTILGTDIDVLDMDGTVTLTERYITEGVPLHLIGVNADKLNMLAGDRRLRDITNGCGIINADGASVIMAGRFLKKPLPERVAGIDLMQRLVALSAEKGYSVYLLGAKQEVVEATAAELKKRHPELNIIGLRNGYFSEEEWPSISAGLKELRPDITFVGISSPAKEYLVDFLQRDGCGGVFMGVGGSFDVISGNISRAPLWMQKAGLEWLFRVLQEPRRLFKRYFVGNWVFASAVIKEKFRKK